jgi:hypothetical protein
VSPEKKPKTEKPIVIRRSLRTRGMPPDYLDSKGLEDLVETAAKVTKSSPRTLGPLSTRDAYRGTGSDKVLIERVLGVSRKPYEEFGDKNGGGSMRGACGSGSCMELGALSLKPENIARVVPGRIMNVRFFPCKDARMVVVGNKFGNIGFWNVDCDMEEKDGIYLYHPHPGPISGISIHQHCLPKVIWIEHCLRKIVST